MTTVTDSLAGIIRQVDGDNTLPAARLGREIAAKLPPFFQTQQGDGLVAFVERTNADKQVVPTYRYTLNVEIPDVRLELGGLTDNLERAGVDMHGPLERSVSGEVRVDGDLSADQIRTWLVNELCADHRGKTAAVTEFSLTAAIDHG
jgi:hypothetical protein